MNPRRKFLALLSGLVSASFLGLGRMFGKTTEKTFDVSEVFKLSAKDLGKIFEFRDVDKMLLFAGRFDAFSMSNGFGCSKVQFTCVSSEELPPPTSVKTRRSSSRDLVDAVAAELKRLSPRFSK